MIKEFNGKRPRIAESVFVSESAYVVGDVEIGEGSSVWPGAVIRGDFGAVIIGRDTAVEDNCVLHAASPSSSSRGLTIGDSVVVGHGAVVNCRRIGNQVLIGMNATILHGAKIGELCIIGAATLVGQGMIVPDNSFVAGVPGEIVGEPSESQLWWVRDGAQEYVRLAAQYKKQGL